MNTEKWTTQLDENTAKFKEAFGHLSAEELNLKLNAQTWSVGQVIDHLIVTNESYYPVVKSVRDGSYKVPFTGKFGFMVNFFGNFILKAVQPDNKKKIKTFPVWEPHQSNIPADIVARFEKHQTELKQFVKDNADLVEKGALISSPANRNIVYKVEALFDILVAHEKRHFEQARGIMVAKK